MRIIFLDIDGVLNSEAWLLKLDEKHRQLGHNEPTRPKSETTCECYRLENQIDHAAVVRLNHLVAQTDAKIVVSSSWRKLLDPPELARVLAGQTGTMRRCVRSMSSQIVFFAAMRSTFGLSGIPRSIAS